MTTKEYLSQAFTLDRILKARQSQIEELRAMQTAISRTVFGDKVQSSPKPDRMAELTVKLLDMIADYQRDVERLLDIKAEIKRAVDKLARADYKLILTERYINLKSLEEIAVDMHYTYRHTTRLIKRAIEKVSLNVLS